MSGERSRRQSRGKQPKSYRLDDEYSFLEEDSSAPSGTQTPISREPQDDGDEFMPDVQEDEPDDEFDEDLADEDDSDGEFGETDVHSTRDKSVLEVIPSPTPLTPAKNKTKKNHTAIVQTTNPTIKGSSIKPRNADSDKLRTRGVADFSKIGGQEIRLKDLFGPESEDLKPILATRDYWYTQETLPLRQTGGLKRSFFESSNVREKETRALRGWYADLGKDAFDKWQKRKILSTTEHHRYLQNEGPSSLNVLLGAVIDPQLHELKKGSYTNIAETFKQGNNRHGWIFNLGTRVQESQWAPNEEGNVQYLAVAVEQNPPDLRPKAMQNPQAPAFTATKPHPASIQVWAFAAGRDGGLDTSIEPHLALVICTDWGAPKFFRWCPIEVETSNGLPEPGGHDHVGVLAGIWSDGRVRILDVSIPKVDKDANELPYYHYTSAAFDVAFPQTVPTCLHWLSGTTLAVATATGTVAIWTLTRPGTLQWHQSDHHIPKPWFYQQLADTYILTISSGWPSQPHYLSISIADGFARLYDIRSPNADTTASIRGRTLCLTQAWHEHTQSFAMPDEHYILKHNPIRRYYHNLYSMRSESSITRVATSPVHPGVLIGGAEGNVEASNPVGRITNYKVIPWQQKWFVHEWRRPVGELMVKPAVAGENVKIRSHGPVADPVDPTLRDEDTTTSAESIHTEALQSVLSHSLVRITEGYKATQPGIQHSIVSKKPTNPEIGKGITVFEEQSAITALAWNPNLKYGTWAVAGTGSGLLRVEDVGV